MKYFLALFFFFSNIVYLSASEKPNIVFIFADDWGWGDLSCHGHPYLKTPNIDRLAKEGTDFQRFTVASGVCSPSRAAVMTGHFPARYLINGHFAWVANNKKRNMPDWLDPDAPLLTRFLQEAGYATAHYGKWHLANDMIPDSPVPGIYSYNDYGAFNCSGEQMPVHDDGMRASQFIEKSHKEKKPFFINLWIHEPHTPFHTIPKYEWRNKHIKDRADQIYASVISHADDRVGMVLDTLDRLELTENTLVIFSSDNGPARAKRPTEPTLQYDPATGAGWGVGAAKGITGGKRGYKASLFEGGIGVPFLARWPGKIPANNIDKTSFLSAVDLLPTFCYIAGVNLPKTYRADGVNQIEMLKGKAKNVREKPLFWRSLSGHAPGEGDHWVNWSVMHDEWKLVADNHLNHVELYHVVSDFSESNNLADKHPDIVKSLKQKIVDWQKTLPPKPEGHVFSGLRNTHTNKK